VAAAQASAGAFAYRRYTRSGERVPAAAAES
jgi:hypothetical protein